MIRTVLFLFVSSQFVCGNGVLRWGFGAGDTGAAGAFGVTEGSAITAVQGNPAVLSTLDREMSASLRFLSGSADFERGGVSTGLTGAQGFFPDLALSWKGSGSDWTFGAGVSVISGQEADWLYPDVAGGIGGISYGEVSHESRYAAVRLSVGAGYRVNDQLSLGLSVGLVGSEVVFDAPFIFQSDLALQGAKVNLDMEGDDLSPTVTLGALYQIRDDWSVGIQVTPPVSFDHRGRATANFSAQLPPLGLAGAPPINRYEARIQNELPLSVSFGTRWQATEKLSLALRADHFWWESSYDDLRVDLRNGDNATINGAIGSAVWDEVPVRWRNRWVVALGAQYELSSAWTVRGGWRYAKSPIPEEFVTPLNGAILEQALTLGVGWQREDWKVDFAWAHEFGSKAVVRTSGYQAGEYSNSSLDLSVNHFSLSIQRAF